MTPDKDLVNKSLALSTFLLNVGTSTLCRVGREEGNLCNICRTATYLTLYVVKRVRTRPAIFLASFSGVHVESA